MSDYLWDRTGTPDRDVRELERLLAPLALPPERRPLPRLLAIAACVVLCVSAWLLMRVAPGGVSTTWVVASTGRHLRAGEAFRVQAPVEIASDEVGRIQLEGGAEMRVLESAQSRQRLELRQGRMHALIWAPPSEFVVDTPSARAVDLGCQYDLTVDAHGDGYLSVKMGWVAFQSGHDESFIPSGAACRTTRLRGPGIPFFEDATAEFRSALERYERDRSALDTLLAAARREDGLTLWHLVERADTPHREAVYDRLASLYALKVDRSKALARDPATLDECWNALDLSDAAWWRRWKRTWRP